MVVPGNRVQGIALKETGPNGKKQRKKRKKEEEKG